MATKAPPEDRVETPKSPPSVNGAGEVMEPPTPLATLPEGFVRLSDTRRKQTGDPYAPLRPFVGKMIQLDGIEIAADGKSGQMEFSEFRPEGDPEGETLENIKTFKTPIPKGALKAIIAAGKAHPEETIVTKVVQTKRGMALR